MLMNRFIYNKYVWVWVVLLGALASVPLYGSHYTIIFLSTVLMYVVITVSWTLFSGPTGYISLAPAAFFGSASMLRPCWEPGCRYPWLSLSAG